MPISVTATEVARNFNGVMEKARAAGSVTVIKNSRPIAQIIPIDKVEEEHMESNAVKLGKEFIDEYADVFAELAK
ncbi:type II toxin-antitoxin system prevent-host-death family antitoxin [Eggerthella timonensis]|uniref:type II toxin-antitoxin system prevent-host-death family antitoxin n=1 Tax=Eggerthella timonensis TaxID=1871008 RepID=UPI000C792219|nr:type II toxin-antitoxin system prevent-host-death family antitoxin [Eggerthella timonensis]